MKRLGSAWLLAVLALATMPPERTMADQRWRQSNGVWKAIDSCTRAAIKAYPDYTPEALAKREAHRRLCLRQANLPGGDPPPPPPH